MAEGKLVHRGGVLLASEQRPEGDAGEAQHPPVELLLAFTRALIRLCPSGDRMTLAMIQARNEVEVSDEQADAFVDAITGEMSQSPWPKGFF
jgi:hypothetical protein